MRNKHKYMRAFAEAWPDAEFVQAVLAQLPWHHQLALLDKLRAPNNRRWYAAKIIERGWSCSILMQIETRLLERNATAITNFDVGFPKPQSDLTRESLKDPYRFTFLGLTDEAQEREIENALVKHVTEFQVELGAGFAFVGWQVQARPSRPAVVLSDRIGPLSQNRIRQPDAWPLLCKSKNRIVAEYALDNKTQSMSVAEYELLESSDQPAQHRIDRA